MNLLLLNAGQGLLKKLSEFCFSVDKKSLSVGEAFFIVRSFLLGGQGTGIVSNIFWIMSSLVISSASAS